MPREATLRHLASLYAASPDPWGHLSRPYERAKYADTLAALGPGALGSALEIGSGNGALSVLLAPRCARLHAIEAVARAFEAARARLAAYPHVTLLRGVAPRDLPEIAPDLIVLSEVLYFLEPEDIDALAAWIAARAAPGARVLAVNWTGRTQQALDGRQAADRLGAALGGWSGPRVERAGYILDLLSRGD